MYFYNWPVHVLSNSISGPSAEWN